MGFGESFFVFGFSNLSPSPAIIISGDHLTIMHVVTMMLPKNAYVSRCDRVALR